MIHTIKLGGKQRGLLFGNYVFKKLKDEQQFTMDDLLRCFSQLDAAKDVMENGDAKDFVYPDIGFIYPAIYHALRAAEIYGGHEKEMYDIDTVCVWMDMEQGTLFKVLPWIVESVASMTHTPDDNAKENGQAKKKMKQIG